MSYNRNLFVSRIVTWGYIYLLREVVIIIILLFWEIVTWNHVIVYKVLDIFKTIQQCED